MKEGTAQTAFSSRQKLEIKASRHGISRLPPLTHVGVPQHIMNSVLIGRPFDGKRRNAVGGTTTISVLQQLASV